MQYPHTHDTPGVRDIAAKAAAWYFHRDAFTPAAFVESLNQTVLIGSALLVLSIVASAVSSRLGAPILLVFLALGMLAGEDGPGGIRFDDLHTSYLVGTVALAVILFDGGMRTRYATFRTGLWPAILLATIGVLMTCGIVGALAAQIMNLPWMYGLLLGAIVGSTDAAAVFSVLHSRGIALKQRVASTLEIESGSNDPMAIFLTLLLIEAVRRGDASLASWTVLGTLLQQFGVGSIVGLAGGKMLVALINRLSLATALYPLLALAGGLLIYAVTTQAGGSGFLAIYLAGLVLGNSRLQAAQNILRVQDGLAWLSQIAMFLILGLLVTPSEVTGIAGNAALVALALMFVARPIAVVLSLLPFRFPPNDLVFISWVGLRGAVPIILALFPLLAGLDNARLFFNTAFFVVIISLLVQGWTVAPAARLLKLEVPPGSEPLTRTNLDIPGHLEYELISYLVAPRAFAASKPLREVGLPHLAQVSAVVRGGSMIPVSDEQSLVPGDLVYIVAVPEHVEQLNRLFDPHVEKKGLELKSFFGEFELRGNATLADLEAMYGLRFDDKRPDDTSLDLYLKRRFHGRPVVGDRIAVGRSEFIVKDMDGGKIAAVGFRLRRP